MKYGKLVDIVQSGNIIIPLYIYKEFPKLNIDMETFMFLMYLYSKGNKIPFDVNTLSSEFFCDIKKIMQYIGELQSKKLLDIKVIKNDKNIMEEFIYLDFFYEKISLSIVGQSVEEDKSVDTEDIFAILEKELGKQLSPIEIEIVKAWKGYNYSDEMIKAAIKEATTNGVTSLKYIDKVLYAWNKKGINNKVEKFEQKDKTQKVDVFDYDWMDDDE